MIGRRGHLRSPIRNEVEHSAQIFLAECSTLWPSAQDFRSIIQPNYHNPQFSLLYADKSTRNTGPGTKKKMAYVRM